MAFDEGTPGEGGGRLRSCGAVCAIICAIALAVTLFADASAAAKACMALCEAAMAVAVAIDVRERRIPRACCAVIAVAGAVLQAVVAGAAGVAAGAAFAIVAVSVCMLANKIAARRGDPGQIGWGDIRCMAALSLASGTSACAGAAACFIVAAAFSLVGMVAGKLTTKDALPFAPFLACWLVVGLAFR